MPRKKKELTDKELSKIREVEAYEHKTHERANNPKAGYARYDRVHEEGYARKPSREYKDAVRNALKKLKAIPHIGAQMGRIAMNCPSSSAIGRLSQSISFCGINI